MGTTATETIETRLKRLEELTVELKARSILRDGALADLEARIERALSFHDPACNCDICARGEA